MYYILCLHIDRTIDASSGFTSTHAQTFARAVRRKLEQYHELIFNDRAIVAAVVDPRTKGAVLEKVGISVAQQRESFVRFFEKFHQNMSVSNIKLRVVFIMVNLIILWSIRFDRTFASSRSSEEVETAADSFLLDLMANSSPQSSAETAADEVCRWIRLDTGLTFKTPSRDVCASMRIREKEFPRIVQVARELFCCMSTSVPSEQAFSRAGRVVDNKRARLGDESIQILMELESWNRFLKN